MALAIDREATSIEKIGDAYKMRIEIAAQALFFDFNEKQVLGGFPIVLDYIDVSAAKITDDQVVDAYRHMLFDASDAHTLVPEFLAVLSRISVPQAAKRHMRVTSVSIAPNAEAFLARFAPGQDPGALKERVAREFGKYLAANQSLSILPYQSNQAIGSSMAARFVEGEAYQLRIPEADYAITLSVAGFKKIEKTRNRVSTLFLYGAFVDIGFSEPLSGKVYFSQRVKQGASKLVPVTQANVDDWSAAYETLLMLFDNFTRTAGQPESDWVSSALPSSKAVKSQFSSLANLIKACR